MFEKVDQKVSFPELEKQLMARWKEEGTFQKSLDLRAGKPRFVFYEGPPTANGKPATHHILARAFKDLFPRYKTMRGYYVERKAGWDTHGLPVEIEVEKQLKFTGKQDIEKFGIEAFNKLCRESVFKYIDQFADVTERMGYWVDLDKASRRSAPPTRGVSGGFSRRSGTSKCSTRGSRWCPTARATRHRFPATSW